MKFLSFFGAMVRTAILSLVCLPTTAFAQASTDGVMRLVCFESSDSDGRPVDGGWFAVITQLTNEVYPADIFIPDEDGAYAEMFPMFENTTFLISIFENVEISNPSGDINEISAELLTGDDASQNFVAEGNRVNSLLDLSWGGSNRLKYDSINSSLNMFVDIDQGVELTPTCDRPFILN